MAAMPALPSPVNNIALSGITEAQRPALAGPILFDSKKTTSLGGGHGEGETVDLQLRVVRSSETGLLDFYYRFTPLSDTAPPENAAAVNVLFNLAGLKLTFADFRLDGLGTIPPSRFANGEEGNSSNFTFIFDHAVPPGENTRFFFVSTNARAFSETAGRLLLGRQAGLAIPGPSGL